MIDFWATLGLVCHQKDVHDSLFAASDPTQSFQQLQDLSAALTSHGFRLSRWEVMCINRILSQEWDTGGLRKVYFRSAAQDKTIVRMRAGWPPAKKTGGYYSHDAYAIFGLACIDTNFRDQMHSICKNDPAPYPRLRYFLTHADEIGPEFKVSDVELEVLHKAMLGNGDQMRAQMNYFETTRWVQPAVHSVFGGCDAGYSRKEFFYVSQQDLAIFLLANPDIKAQMLGARVIQ